MQVLTLACCQAAITFLNLVLISARTRLRLTQIHKALAVLRQAQNSMRTAFDLLLKYYTACMRFQEGMAAVHVLALPRSRLFALFIHCCCNSAPTWLRLAQFNTALAVLWLAHDSMRADVDLLIHYRTVCMRCQEGPATVQVLFLSVTSFFQTLPRQL